MGLIVKDGSGEYYVNSKGGQSRIRDGYVQDANGNRFKVVGEGMNAQLKPMGNFGGWEWHGKSAVVKKLETAGETTNPDKIKPTPQIPVFDKAFDDEMHDPSRLSVPYDRQRAQEMDMLAQSGAVQPRMYEDYGTPKSAFAKKLQTPSFFDSIKNAPQNFSNILRGSIYSPKTPPMPGVKERLEDSTGEDFLSQEMKYRANKVALGAMRIQ
jgi:hypothetical protein